MSPSYKETYVPKNRAAEFEAFVAQIGGQFEGKTQTAEEKRQEAQPLWQQRVAEAQRYLDQFIQQAGSEVTESRNRNLLAFISDIFTPPGSASPVGLKPDIDVNRVKFALYYLIRNNLIAEPPEGIFLTPAKAGPRLTSSLTNEDLRQRGQLLPDGIIYTLDRYGLHDGQVKTDKALSEKFDVSPGTISGTIERAEATFRGDEGLRNAALIDTSHSIR